MNNLCKNGEVQRINKGQYFICKYSQCGCSFVRWCNNDMCFKMLPSSDKCKLRMV
jgi:hypothetical protein